MHNIKFAVTAGWLFAGLIMFADEAYAQNIITALNVGFNSSMTVIKIDLARPLSRVPDTEFIIGTSPHLVLEFPDTANGLSEYVQDFAEGGLRSANIIQSGERTRLVLYLNQMFPSNTRIDGNSLLITLQGNAGNAGNVALRPAETKQEVQRQTLSYEADARLKAEQETQAAAAEKARQVSEANAAKIKANEEAKAEAVRVKAEQKAKVEATAITEQAAKAEQKIQAIHSATAPPPIKPTEIAAQASPVQSNAAPPKTDITGYTLDGATLLAKAEIDAAVKPFTGKGKDFSDIQLALAAVEATYSSRGFSTVRVSLPEQELKNGAVRFQVVEGRFGKVTVQDNQFVSEANVLNALPSVRSGGVPKLKQTANEIKFANENPARQLNLRLKAGEKTDQVDVDIVVADKKPFLWGLALDNTGTPETGRSRLGLSYRHANLFDADHVGSLQIQTSPTHTDRVRVFSGNYKIPIYELSDSVEFNAGYSNLNSILGGLDAVKGGGATLGAHYNHQLEKTANFDPRLSFALDWRKFSGIYFNSILVSPEIVVMPLSATYATQGTLGKSNLGASASLSANLPGMRKGTATDFAAYNPLANPRYKVARYGANYTQLIGDDWQLRAALSGQYSSDTLLPGEQMRLGGADAVRGFSEGSAGGDSGMRWNLEGYTPNFGKDEFMMRALVFFDAGSARFADGTKSSISSAGIGVRAAIAQILSMRLDAAHIINADTDPLQMVGDWRVHFGLTVSFN